MNNVAFIQAQGKVYTEGHLMVQRVLFLMQIYAVYWLEGDVASLLASICD